QRPGRQDAGLALLRGDHARRARRLAAVPPYFRRQRMTPNSPIKLVSELLDLPLLDVDGKYCGIVDDVELQGGAGKDLELKALQVGPGAYRGRVPSSRVALLTACARESISARA